MEGGGSKLALNIFYVNNTLSTNDEIITNRPKDGLTNPMSDKPPDQQTAGPINQSTKWSTDQLTDLPTDWWPIDRLTNWPTHQLNNKPTDWPTNQPTNQTTNQPTYLPSYLPIYLYQIRKIYLTSQDVLPFFYNTFFNYVSLVAQQTLSIKVKIAVSCHCHVALIHKQNANFNKVY